jgi:PTH1 family peptidyl-tRNA hydrolase
MRFPLFRRTPQLPVKPQFLVVGLGNPGAEYQFTRHNVGFRVVELLAGEEGNRSARLVQRALVTPTTIGETPVLLVRPMTYMNLSGESVAPLMRTHQLQPESVLVITDDLDLPLGKIRIRAEGSPGGHNGLKSLVAHLGTERFPRIRIGIGRPAPGTAVVDHVLSEFTPDEQDAINEAIARAAEAVKVLITEGIVVAMRRFN